MPDEEKRIILTLSVLFLLGIVILLYSFNEPRSFSYSLTKAICEGVTCRDFSITCESNGSIVSMVPITGFVTFPSSWEDTRAGKSLCTP